LDIVTKNELSIKIFGFFEKEKSFNLKGLSFYSNIAELQKRAKKAMKKAKKM